MFREGKQRLYVQVTKAQTVPMQIESEQMQDQLACNRSKAYAISAGTEAVENQGSGISHAGLRWRFGFQGQDHQRVVRERVLRVHHPITLFYRKCHISSPYFRLNTMVYKIIAHLVPFYQIPVHYHCINSDICRIWWAIELNTAIGFYYQGGDGAAVGVVVHTHCMGCGWLFAYCSCRK
jgi:hypothetical protein